MNTTTETQRLCPPWCQQHLPDVVDYTSAPPGRGVTSVPKAPLVCNMAVGDEAWVGSWALFHDDCGKMWVSGGKIVYPYAGDVPGGTPVQPQRPVRLQRTEDGVRLVDWEPESMPRLRPNRDGAADVWVVT